MRPVDLRVVVPGILLWCNGGQDMSPLATETSKEVRKGRCPNGILCHADPIEMDWFGSPLFNVPDNKVIVQQLSYEGHDTST